MNKNGVQPIKLPELKGGKPEITLAPLVDVVFLLLIFFMVTTIFPNNKGLLIERPEASQSESLPVKSLYIAVDSAGVIHHQQRVLSLAALEEVVNGHLLANPKSAVTLEVDRRAETGTLIKVMDACRAGGAEQLAIATRKEDEEPATP